MNIFLKKQLNIKLTYYTLVGIQTNLLLKMIKMMKDISEANPYISKIWLKSYDQEIKENIDIQKFTLVEMLKRAINDFPDNLCYDFRGTTVTYKDFENKVVKFANFLIKSGLKKGERVAIHLPNSPQYLVALFGTFYAGGVSI